jgi:hypothetical protein
MGSTQFLSDDVILIGLISVISLYFLIQHSFLLLWRNACKTSSKRIYLTKMITTVNDNVMSPPQLPHLKSERSASYQKIILGKKETSISVSYKGISSTSSKSNDHINVDSEINTNSSSKRSSRYGLFEDDKERNDNNLSIQVNTEMYKSTNIDRFIDRHSPSNLPQSGDHIYLYIWIYTYV